MSNLKRSCIIQAKSEFGKIYPCGGNCTLDDCFTIYNKKLIFWFNTADKSTHCIELNLSESE